MSLSFFVYNWFHLFRFEISEKYVCYLLYYADWFVSIILEIWQENRKSMSVGNKYIVHIWLDKKGKSCENFSFFLSLFRQPKP